MQINLVMSKYSLKFNLTTEMLVRIMLNVTILTHSSNSTVISNQIKRIKLN